MSKTTNKEAFLRDAAFCQFVNIMEDVLTCEDIGRDYTAEESYCNLEEFSDLMNNVDDATLLQIIKSNEELSEVFDGSIENFKKTIDVNLHAQESIIGSTLLAAAGVHAIGYLLHAANAFLKRNRNTLAWLKPGLVEAEQRIKEAPDSKFAGGPMSYPVFSPKLPAFDAFSKNLKALAELVQYAKSVNPTEFSADKANEIMKGTDFYKSTVSKVVGKTAKEVGHAVGYITPIVHSVTTNTRTHDIRNRGWGSKHAFTEGLKIAKDGVKAIEAVSDVVKRITEVKQTADKEAIKGAKTTFRLMKLAVSEASSMIRGYIVATQKITSSAMSKALGKASNTYNV